MSDKLYKTILGVLICILLVGVAFLMKHIDETSTGVTRKVAIEESAKLANILKIIRAKYTHEVVKPVKEQGKMRITHDYKNTRYKKHGGAIPLPATLSMEIAKEMSTDSTEIALVSKYPFPWREERILTKFQSRAWDYFVENATSDKPYYEIDKDNNIINYAIPDKMTDQTCVNCHNTYKDTPRTNWKLGDVRGIISIAKPIQNSRALTKGGIAKTIQLILFCFFIVVIAIVVIVVKNRENLSAVNGIDKVVSEIAVGNLPKELLKEPDGQVGTIVKGINAITTYIKKVAEFSEAIGNGKFDTKFEVRGDKDALGKALVQMRSNLEEVRKADENRSWAAVGLANFSDILRAKGDSLDQLSDNILSNLVKYLNASQGSIFIINDDGKLLEATATYAWNAKQERSKTIEKGESLAGRAWKEAETIYVTDVPADYMQITSGVGAATPTCLLIVPMKIEAEVYGVIEIAAFKLIEAYQIEFIEKLAESIAITISTTKVAIKTTALLEDSRAMTEQMQAQDEEMRQNMEELQATQEEMERSQTEMLGQKQAMDNAAWVTEVNINDEITYINDAFCDALGYTREELIGKKLDYLRSPDNPKEVLDDLLNTKLKGKIWNGKLKLKTNPDSNREKIKWVKTAVSPILNSEGKVEKYIGVRFDITEQVAQEEKIKLQIEEAQAQDEEMRQNMEELQATQEEMEKTQQETQAQQNAFNKIALVSETNLKGFITYVNDEFCRVSGYKREELIGQNHNIIRHPDMPAAAFKDMWATIGKGKSWVGRVKNKTKDGGFYWVNAAITPVMGTNGKPVKYIGVRFDITKEVAQEEMVNSQMKKLQATQLETIKQQAFLKAITDNTSDTIFSIDTTYHISVINKTLKEKYEKLGIDLSVGKNILDLIPEDKKAFWKGRYDRALNGEQFETIDDVGNGTKAKVSHYPIYDENKNITGVAVVSRVLG